VRSCGCGLCFAPRLGGLARLGWYGMPGVLASASLRGRKVMGAVVVEWKDRTHP
jgi:hypothetical protein